MDKRHEVLKYLQTVESATVANVYQNVPFGYYHNGHKYIGEILSRMVKHGMVERVKKGTYKFIRSTKPNQRRYTIENSNQIKLF